MIATPASNTSLSQSLVKSNFSSKTSHLQLPPFIFQCLLVHTVGSLKLLISTLSISILSADTSEAFMKSWTLLCAVSDSIFRFSTNRLSLILNSHSILLCPWDKTKLKIDTFHKEEYDPFSKMCNILFWQIRQKCKK